MQTIEYKSGESTASLRARLPYSEGGCAVALGFFDGVHLAHRALLKEAKRRAEELGLAFAVFTFTQESAGLKGGRGRLYSTEDKLELLDAAGADYVVICDFSAVRELSAEEFINDFLIGALGARVAVCGYNYRFGKGASGDCDTLLAAMKKAGREAVVLGEYFHGGVSLSSTAIKTMLSERRLTEAAVALGLPYFISGTVTHGLGLGRELGVPTVNTDLPPKRFTLPCGVYLTAMEIDGELYPSLTNVGTCPTFSERALHAETSIIDFDREIYGKRVRVYFLSYIREERRFSSKEELIMQINIDKKEALKLLEDIKWQEIGLNLR